MFRLLPLVPLILSALFTDYYVRPNGHDTLCNGKFDVDYSTAVAPNCAFKGPQKMLDTVTFGDTGKVQGGATFTTSVGFNLTNKGVPTNTARDCGADRILITTNDPDGTPAALFNYPAQKTLITPQMAARMPKLVTSSGYPALWVNANARCWVVERLEFTSLPGSNTIRLVGTGENDPRSLSEFPDRITFRYNYLHPAEEVGQPATAATLDRSAESAFYFEGTRSDFIGNAMQGFVRRYPDGSAAAPTGLLITTWGDDINLSNNLIQAWTYSWFFGGGSKSIAFPDRTGTVSNCTATSCAFSNTAGITVGRAVAILVHTYTDSIGIFREVWGTGRVASVAGSTVNFEKPLCWGDNDPGGNTCLPFNPATSPRNLPTNGIPPNGAQARWDGLQPQNIRVTRNIVDHPLEWGPLMGNNCGGKGYYELKACKNCSIIGNIFSGCTGGTTTARNQGGPDPWNNLDNLLVANNWFKDWNNGMVMYLNDGANLTSRSRNVRYYNNLYENIFVNRDDFQYLKVISGVFSGGDGTSVEHNTALGATYSAFSSYADEQSRMLNLSVRNNLFHAAPNPCFTDGSGVAGAPITSCWPNAQVQANVLIKTPERTIEDLQATWFQPYPNNWLAPSIDGIFAGGTHPLDKYKLAATSPYKGKGTDGKDPGVDIEELKQTIFGSAPVPMPTATPITTPTPAPTLFTWEKLAGSPEKAQTLAFVGPVLYVGTMQGGVWAYDGTWRQVNGGFPSTPVWIGNFHVTRAGSLLASVRFSGMAQSSTWRLSGGVWSESTGARNEYATFYASDKDGNVLASTNTAGVLRSTDDGRTFQSFSQVPAVGGVSSSSFSLGNGLNNIIYLHSHDTGEFYSTDGGFTWNHLGSGSGPWGNQTALTSNAAGQLIAATGFGGIYRNRGTLTSPSIQLETNLQVANDTGAHSLIRLGDGTLVSHFIRLFCSKDGGAAWVRCDGGIPAGTTSGAQNVQSLHTGDLAQGPDGKVYAGFLDAGVGVYRTTTGGPAPTPSPTPVASPSPQPTPPSGSVGIQGYVFADGERVPGATVVVAGRSMSSRIEDAYFWWDEGVPLGSIIEVSKAGYEFPKVTVVAGTVDQLYFVSGRQVSQPVPTPTATPTPVPSPTVQPTPLPSPLPSPTVTPTPTPTPVPTPQPSPPACEMAIVAPVLPQWSSGVLKVSITSPVPRSFSLTATSSSGQVIVLPPPTQSFTNAMSITAEFKLQSKNKNGAVTISGPCGSRVVPIVVRR